MDWKFEKTETEFKKVPAGKHRLRIEDAVMKKSKNGNDMIELTLAVSGYNNKIWHYIVFMLDKPEVTNRNLTAIMDSFGIEMGDLNIENWKGKVGAGTIKYDENEYAKVGYFINKVNQDKLPSWVEPSSDGKADDFVTVPQDEELPF